MFELQVASHGDRQIAAGEVLTLNQVVGWWPERTEQDFASVLAPTASAVGAWSASSLVGFARAVTDGRLHAYIDDVMVHPDWRRRGIATAVVEALVADLDVTVVTLFCGADLVPLYQRSGFVPTKQVMLHRHRPRAG